MVPGISSSIAAPACGNIPLTMRGVADQFLVTTAFGRNRSIPALPPFAATRTYVFLMGVGRLRDISRQLVDEQGFPSDLPVGIVHKASTPEQKVYLGLLSDIADLAEREQVKAPSTIVMGYVVGAIRGGAQPVHTVASPAYTDSLEARRQALLDTERSEQQQQQLKSTCA